MLCRMWYAKTRGEVTGSVASLAKISNSTMAEFDLFLNEVKTLGFCEVSHNSNNILTITNRRMYRNEKKKESARLRAKRFYDKKAPERDSTKTSRPLSSSSSSELTSPSKKKGIMAKGDFDLFWQHYPKKVSKGQARKTWDKIYKNIPPTEILINKLQQLKLSSLWIEDSGKYIPHPSTWLNNEGWEDEPQEHRPDLMPKSISEAERLEERLRGKRLQKEADDDKRSIDDK